VFSELDEDMDMGEFHQHCKELAAAIGYSDKSIQKWFEPDDERMDELVAAERSLEELTNSLNSSVDFINYVDEIVNRGEDTTITLKEKIDEFKNEKHETK